VAVHQRNAEKGARLVNQAKGIYKPHYTDFALSVRQTLNSPYADKEVIRRTDGSWVYPYFQENSNLSDRDKEATNRGLLKCLAEKMPVGALLQVKPKPGVDYVVLGLASVTEWKDGYFILEGYADSGQLKADGDKADAAHDRARAAAAPLSVENFNLDDVADVRERQIAEVVLRRGQGKFREALIAAYAGKCVISGCDAVEALEAAHISPYRGPNTNHPQNGLLLRADLHTLFDLGLLAIDPRTRSVVLADQLTTTSYAGLLGKTIAEANEPSACPSADALAQHLEWTGILELPESIEIAYPADFGSPDTTL